MAPTSNVLYRIQSVDFGTYLELYDVKSGIVVLRPKSDSPLQRWIFTGAGDSFEILNSATKMHKNPQYLVAPKLKDDTDDPQGREAPRSSNQRLEFDIKEVKGGGYVIYYPSRKGKWHTHLQTSEDGKPEFDKIRPIDTKDVSRNLKWRLVEVGPAYLRKGIYRIRAFPTDLGLEIPSGGAAVGLSVLKAGAKHQEWELITIANGRCQIKHVAEEGFLGYKTNESSGEFELIKIDKAFEWKVKEVGKVTYSISFKLNGVKFVLARGAQNELVLKPKKEAKNRLWVFDNNEQSVDDETDTTDGGGITDPETGGAETVIPSTRYQNIVDQHFYYIQNLKSGNYIYGDYDLSVAPGIITQWIPKTGKVEYSGKLRLHYLDNSNKFTLRIGFFSGGNSDYYRFSIMNAAGDSIAVADKQPTDRSYWVLEEEGFSGRYYVHLANEPGKVIEEDVSAGTFKLAPKQRGSPNQLWTFERGDRVT